VCKKNVGHNRHTKQPKHQRKTWEELSTNNIAYYYNTHIFVILGKERKNWKKYMIKNFIKQ
jgi:hypothetical protein